MEKIVKITYKVPVLEYANLGWQGTAEMDCSEFDSFEKAALIELLCKEILRTVIDKHIVFSRTICCDSEWENFQHDVEWFLKNDVITSELFPIVEFEDIQYDDVDDVCGFQIILSKDINSTTHNNIYLTFEY
jgi:hypothetical protein